MERLVVVGGDAGGMSAASEARRRRGPEELQITAFERGEHTSYSACGIPYWIGDVVDGPERLIARDARTFRDEYAIDARVRHEVAEIDLANREVVVRDLDGGGEIREPYDHLVIATGASPIRPDWPGADAEGIFGVQTLDDGATLRAALDRDPRPTRAVVVGAGYIGVEMAEALVNRGLDVTVVEQAEQPMATVDPDMGILVGEAMRGLGIAVRTSERVTGFASGDGRVTAVLTERSEIPADVVVLGLGVRPNSDLAEKAGLPLGVAGGVVTDLRMRVPGHDGIWAAGDCVQTVNLVTGQPTYVPLGTHANKQGRVAGTNIGGGYATFPGVVGTAVTKVCDLEVARTGLRERDATAAGFGYITVTIDSTNRSSYFPGSQAMTVKLIAERRTGRLLGGQIVGRAEAAKRIDVLAVALTNRMTVEEMTALDLGYAPPFSPVWDPVLVAARKAAQAVARR
ncbi:MAG: flavoprotein oxidoreductase [Micromonosporaceae bacterium]|nr:flavoprotein oxidoreductase [Micromonosporaceae bacterium]